MCVESEGSPPLLTSQTTLILLNVQITPSIIAGVNIGISIGSLNLFEVGAYVESTDVGNCNLIRINCRLERQSSLANGCVVANVFQ